MKQALGALDWAADYITPENPINCDCPVCVASDVLRRAIEEAERQKQHTNLYATPSEALRLADAIAERTEPDFQDAAAELRRLQAKVEELERALGIAGKALRASIECQRCGRIIQ